MSSEGSNALEEYLKLDNWWEVVTLLGIVLLVIALLFEVKILSNDIIAGYGVGLILFGIGRWKNQKSFAGIIPGFIVSGERRMSDLSGILLEVGGLFVIVYVTAVVITGSWEIKLF